MKTVVSKLSYNFPQAFFWGKKNINNNKIKWEAARLMELKRKGVP